MSTARHVVIRGQITRKMDVNTRYSSTGPGRMTATAREETRGGEGETLTHDEAHPEVVEGCAECAHTPRLNHYAGQTIDDILNRARLVEKRRVDFDVGAALMRLGKDHAAHLQDVEDIRSMEPDDFREGE